MLILAESIQSYYSKVLRKILIKPLEILADILQNSFMQADIDKKLSVIMQEMASVNDNPDELVYESSTH